MFDLKKEVEKLLEEIERTTDIRKLTMAYDHMIHYESVMRPGNEELYDKVKKALKKRGDYLCSFASEQGTKILQGRNDRLADITCSVFVGPMGIEVVFDSSKEGFEPTEEEARILDDVGETVVEIITYQKEGKLQ